MAAFRKTFSALVLSAAMLAGGGAIPGSASATVPRAELSVNGVSSTTAFTALAPAKTLASKVPTITGTARVGLKLTAKTGAWTAGTKFAYQWYSSGKKINGATKSTLTPKGSHWKSAITVTVTGKLAGYTIVAHASKATKAVLAGKLVSKTPKISGTASVGNVLRAAAGTWTAGTKLSYQWYLGSVKISGATKATFTPKVSHLKKTLTVRVTGKQTGYTSVTTSSKATKAVVTWASAEFGEFPTKKYSGTGDTVIKLPANVKSAVIIATHDGSRNFIVEGLDANGRFSDLPVNEIGRYQGTSPLGLDDYRRGESKFLQVSADGRWTITIAPVSTVPVLKTSGKGPGVFQYNTTTVKTMKLTHNGSSNFIVEYYNDRGWDLIANEIGNYTGLRVVPAGPGVIVVDADGAWTMKLS